MTRRRESGMNLIASMPWPVGIVLGIAAYLLIRYGIGAYLSTSGGSLLQGVGTQASAGAFTPLAWMALTLCWIAAGASFVRSRHRRRLLETQTGLDSVKALSWREFEMLVGEAFRRRGYGVEETGLGGADGGIDLILRKDGRTELVQCKQWRNQQVKPNVVREMWGLRAHHGADGVKIVCVGDYTRDAAAFAEGKVIELINGNELLALVREGQAVKPSALQPSRTQAISSAPDCPTCGSTMILRTNRTNGQSFWGCSSYPRCRGTAPA
jgi:restriction system protein